MTMHDGHRKRMRERFRKEGLEGFAPHEVVELLLYYAKARGDVNPLAHSLLEEFGSLKGLLEARTEQLMAIKGVGEETATLISLVLPLFRRYQEELCANGAVLTRYSEAVQYCRALMAGLRHERLYLISLSSQGVVVGRRIVGEGSIDEVHAYPRLVVEAALNHNAYAVILCHNHPGGRAEPSAADLEVTRQIALILQCLGIRLRDHIIVSGEDVYSMSMNGQLVQESERGRSPREACRAEEMDRAWQEEGASD